jgi:glycosyltransferase 2 family protein
MPDPEPQSEKIDQAKTYTCHVPVTMPDKTDVGNRNWKKWLIKFVKFILIIVILASVARQIQMSWDKLPSIRPHFPLLILSGVLYIAGLWTFGIYYAHVVRLVAPKLRVRDCLKAYILSHPAKYVPGKAMVVILRVGMLSKAGSRSTAAMLATLYETLSMMAVGSLLGGLLLHLLTRLRLCFQRGLGWHFWQPFCP